MQQHPPSLCGNVCSNRRVFSCPGMSFQKPALTYEQQIELLKSRGLTILDEAFAKHCLAHFNYYRLSAYRRPFTEPGNYDRFRAGVTFDDLWALYCFDRKLRGLVTEGTKSVEISVRSRWAYEIGHHYGPLAYENPANFNNLKIHKETLERIDRELVRTRDETILHFRRKHQMPRPPVWAVCEVMTFGTLSQLYAIMRENRIRKEVAASYDFSPDVLESVLHHLSYVRNICAHHGRLWDRKLTITGQLPRKRPRSLALSLNPAAHDRIYTTLAILAHLNAVIWQSREWTSRLLTLIDPNPSNILGTMGFPNDWRERSVWHPASE